MSTPEDLDSRLGAALGAQLHDELADLTAPPGLAVAVRRRRARHRWALTGALTLPVVAAGVAVALVVPAAPTGARGGPPTDAGAAQPHTAAFLAAHTQQALDGTGGSIVHTVTNVDDGTVNETWWDRTGARTVTVMGPGGAPAQAVQESLVGDQVTMLTVDYTRHVWWRNTVSEPEKVPVATAFGVPYADPDRIRADLARGALVLIGNEQVAGHATEHLRMTLNIDGTAAVAEDLWVDSATFLPVRLIGQKGPKGFTVFYEWLPRTAENLARLELTPPAGFTEQPSGAKDGAAGAPKSPAATPTAKAVG
jgi:hypothetical protein